MVKSADGAYSFKVRRRAEPFYILINESSTLRYNTLCNNPKYIISIYNNLDILIKELVLTESDLCIIIDNLNTIIYEGIINETYIYFKCNNTTMIDSLLHIERIYDMNKILEYHDYFTIYDYINERINKLFTINMTDKLDQFIDEIYSAINVDKN